MAGADPRTIVFALEGPIAPEAVRWMCERVRFLLEAGDTDHVICDVSAVLSPDAGTVEALARMQLAARGVGRRMKVRGACGELKDLVAMAGLRDVLPCDELPVEALGQAEQWEPASGVEEERDPADPVV